MKLRSFETGDLDQVLQLFRETVHSVNAADYTPEQLDAWAPEEPDRVAWQERLTGSSAFVVEDDGSIVGFGNLTKEGCVDTLYVHKDGQKKGIGTAILMRLIGEARSGGLQSIETSASITARPFFEKEGFTVLKEAQRERNGVVLTNYVMRLDLPRPDAAMADDNGEGE